MPQLSELLFPPKQHKAYGSGASLHDTLLTFSTTEQNLVMIIDLPKNLEKWLESSNVIPREPLVRYPEPKADIPNQG
jgi:hypothetical protein